GAAVARRPAPRLRRARGPVRGGPARPGRGRPGPAPPGPGEPARQRDQVHPRPQSRRRRGRPPGGGGGRGVLRARQRGRLRSGAGRQALRGVPAVPQRGRVRGDGRRPGHRATGGRASRRPGGGRGRPRRGRHVLLHAPGRQRRARRAAVSDAWRLLLIDDNPDDRMFVRRALARELSALDVREAGDPAALATALEAGPYDLVITDYALGFTNGLLLLEMLKERWPECPVILCTGTLSEEIAVKALQTGLDDYVLKAPQRLLRLPAAVRGAIAHARQRAAALAAERRYEALFQGAPVGLVRSRRDGPMLAANAAAARIWGYPDVAAFLQVNSGQLYADPADRTRLLATIE